MQKNKAERLLALHSGKEALVLPNVWSPIGARILEAKGFSAVATASAAISASLGYKDGEKIKFSTLIDIASRIASSVDVPTTVDIETGYAATLDELRSVITSVLDAGIVGINIEDSIDCGLRSISEQAQRIAVIREVSSKYGIHLVINARIDSFISGEFCTPEDQIEETINRAKAYFKAGADCVYPICIDNIEILKRIRGAISGPVNALVMPNKITMHEMHGVGINRFSFGPFIFRSLMFHFTEIIDELSKSGSINGLENKMLSNIQIQQYLRGAAEE